jgi:hypothetical protein
MKQQLDQRHSGGGGGVDCSTPLYYSWQLQHGIGCIGLASSCVGPAVVHWFC